MNKGKQRGITLIALIITIIIMLILVAVTVTVAVNGDLFGKAEDAVDKTNKKVGELQKDIDKYTDKLNEVTEEPDYFTYEYDEETGTAILTGVKEEYSVNDHYEDETWTLYIQDGNQKITKIEIPEKTKYNGKEYVVTEIGDKAFGSYEDYTEWEEIIIPETVRKIGNHAFDGCDVLTNINIPNSVTAIGEKAFYCCESLTKINIPDSVITIGSGAFRGWDEHQTINCQVSGKPSGWANDWIDYGPYNSTNVNVNWGVSM